MEDVWKPIRLPNNLKETITEWLESSDGGLGVCLLCAGRIMSEDPWCWGRTGIGVVSVRALNICNSIGSRADVHQQFTSVVDHLVPTQFVMVRVLRNSDPAVHLRARHPNLWIQIVGHRHQAIEKTVTKLS